MGTWTWRRRWESSSAISTSACSPYSTHSTPSTKGMFLNQKKIWRSSWFSCLRFSWILPPPLTEPVFLNIWFGDCFVVISVFVLIDFNKKNLLSGKKNPRDKERERKIGSFAIITIQDNNTIYHFLIISTYVQREWRAWFFFRYDFEAFFSRIPLKDTVEPYLIYSHLFAPFVIHFSLSFFLRCPPFFSSFPFLSLSISFLFVEHFLSILDQLPCLSLSVSWIYFLFSVNFLYFLIQFTFLQFYSFLSHPSFFSFFVHL